MARKRIKSRHGLFGTVYYYDESGNRIGKSRPGLLDGSRVYTDRNGRYAGKSRSGIFAEEVFEDTDHNRVTSYDGLFGEVHFKNGVPVGDTKPGFFGCGYTTLETGDNFSEKDPLDYDGTAYEANTVDCEKQNTKSYGWIFVLFLVFCAAVAGIYVMIR